MTPTFIVVILALLWAGITGDFSGFNLLFGAAIGGLAVAVLRASFAPPRALRKLRRILSLAGLFLYELLASAVRVALVVVRPDIRAAVRPAIVAVPLTVRSDAEITLLANLITLTPGTLSIDLSEDRSVLYVHVLALDSREALIAGIVNGFERKVREVFE